MCSSDTRHSTMPTSFSSQLQEKLRSASISHTTPGKLGSEGVNARLQPADAGANPLAPVVAGSVHWHMSWDRTRFLWRIDRNERHDVCCTW